MNSAEHALRNHVSRLRRVLSAAAGDEPRLAARGGGYLLRVEPGESASRASSGSRRRGGRRSQPVTPLRRRRRCGPRKRSGRTAARGTRVRAARASRGGAAGGARLGAVEERVDAELALGSHLALVPELEALVAEHPYRERFRAQLMLALYRCGRQAEGSRSTGGRGSCSTRSWVSSPRSSSSSSNGRYSCRTRR